MSSLAEIISNATEANTESGIVKRHSALNVAFLQVKEDPELAEQCIRSDLSRRIKAQATRISRNIENQDGRQVSMFGLKSAYALDDQDHNVKETDILTRAEFEGLINLRQKQVHADLMSLSKLREAMRQTQDIWDRNPEWVWGQVEAAYARLQAQAA